MAEVLRKNFPDTYWPRRKDTPRRKESRNKSSNRFKKHRYQKYPNLEKWAKNIEYRPQPKGWNTWHNRPKRMKSWHETRDYSMTSRTPMRRERELSKTRRAQASRRWAKSNSDMSNLGTLLQKMSEIVGRLISKKYEP